MPKIVQVLLVGAMVLGLLPMLDPGSGAASQDFGAAADLLERGAYDEAVRVLEERHADDPGPESALPLVEVLLEVGRMERAESVLRSTLEHAPADHEFLYLLGRTLMERGHLDEATAAFDAAAAGSGGIGLLAELHRGMLLLRRGEREAAFGIFDGFIDVYNLNPNLGSRELVAVAGAVRQLGVTNPALFHDAVRAYDEAIEADPTNLQARLELGDLFLEKYNIPDARQAYREVLDQRARHPLALLGLARAAELEGSAEVIALVDQVLEINPDLVPALVQRARLHLRAEAPERAEPLLLDALDTNPASREALAVLAAHRLLEGHEEGFETLRDQALALNPADAEFFVVVAELAAANRLYHRAAALGAQATTLDSLSWRGFGVQGLNELRTGRMESGRRNLDIAFNGDPFNLWIKNTLDLLDVMDTFEVHRSGPVEVWLDPEDGQVLASYMLPMAERAYRTLVDRYGHAPPGPIRVEAFRRSADFSVRTVGLAGLGALGVSFGPVVAMDSPAARGPGGFHWASTLWHELAHTFHLEITDHRVPRWFSEGLAVQEERLAGPGWGMRPTLGFLAAYLEDRLRPPSELSRSFVQPTFPEEVGFAYILGSMVVKWIEEEHGLPIILGMLSGFQENRSLDEVVLAELGMDLSTFDARFDAWFRRHLHGGFAAAEALVDLRADPGSARTDDVEWLRSRASEAPNDVHARTLLGRLLLQDGRAEDAIAPLDEAWTVFPQNPDPQGPGRLLARAHRELDRLPDAARALREHLANVADDYEGHLELSELLVALGDERGAADALEQALYVHPFDAEVHERLADLYRTLEDASGEIRERRVLLAMNPVDRAGALYRLADAEFRGGLRNEARDTVLDALEIAPRYPEAQDLLLQLLDATEEGE